MTPDLLDFTGRVAIVTGGGTGIGAATASLLAKLGADVVIASRKAEVLDRKAAEIAGATGRRCLAIPTDVRVEEQVVRLVERTVAELGRIDVLVNNAGGTVLSPLETVTTEGWMKSFDLNMHSAFFCTREVGRHFRAQRSGAIVNVSSMAGVNGTRGGAPYAAAKAGLQMFTRVAAAEWGPHGIRVNCVAPGMVVSEVVMEHLVASGLDIEGSIEMFPMRRVGRPEDLANAIVFLASDAASYITGETLAVNGGPVLGGPKRD